MDKILEVCTVSTSGVIAAHEGGASRVELCSALEVGGVTPSPGLIFQSRNAVPGITLHTLIRPRGGDFVYDGHEVEAMIQDIKMAVDNGADGVVIGALTRDGSIDMATCEKLVKAVPAGINITFHRAIDVCRDPFEALEKIISLGCNRILTSGHAADALAGIPVITRLNQLAQGRITILPGAGVGPENAARILALTGCHELHGSLRDPETGLTSSTIVNNTLNQMLSV